MRRWQDLAAPDDPGSWSALRNFWPTRRGYETADFSTGTSVAATGNGPVIYAFCGKTLTGTREFVVNVTGGSGAKVWEYSGGSLTDRTNGISVGGVGGPMMAMFGNVVVCVMGVGTATAVSTSTTFSALAGAPQGEIVVVCRNAVLVLNTDTSADGWAASDVGDYTNWTTGEAASGRLIDTPGPIVAGVVWGDAVYAFKSNSIYRGTYVGGVVKWRWEVVWQGIGASGIATTFGGTEGKYQVVACREGIAFNAEAAADANSVYLFDGASPPYCLNPLTTLNESASVFCYHPIEDVLIVAPSYGSDASGTYRAGTPQSNVASLYYYYSFRTRAWGNGSGSEEEDWELNDSNPQQAVNGVLQGDYYARAETSIKPVYWRYRNVAEDAFYRCAPSTSPSGTANSVTCYATTTRYYDPKVRYGSDQKTKYDRLIPVVYRRTDLGTNSASLTATFYREIDDTSAASTQTISESGTRKRFDFLAEDNFATFKVTWTAEDIELADFYIRTKPGALE